MARIKNSKKRQAEDFFIANFDITQKEVAAMFGVTENTVSEWARKGDWAAKRDDYHASPIKIRELLQKELLSVAQGNAPKLHSDAVSKLHKVIEELRKTAHPVVIQAVLKDLDNFISETNPKLATEVTKFHREFLIHRINQES